jgi:hypothetical protein
MIAVTTPPNLAFFATASNADGNDEHSRGTTFALRMNGRTRFVSLRYCGSKTSISPNFVCQRSFFTVAMHRRLLTMDTLKCGGAARGFSRKA